MLPNARHEKFAQLVAGGATGASAYRDSGYSPNGADRGAERLLRNVEVAKRVAELRQETTRSLNFDRIDFQRLCLARFKTLAPDDAVTAKYGEMLAKSIGFNEPDKIEMTGNLKMIIGGDA